jgi:CHAT domain-containing protein
LLGEGFARARAAGYSHVQARATWFQGLLAFGQGRLGDAQALYEETLATFERNRDAEQMAASQLLLAGVAAQLGDATVLWQHLESSLRRLAFSRNARLRHGVLLAVASSLRMTTTDAALSVLDQAVDNALSSQLPGRLADALRLRALILTTIGERARALDDLAVAKSALRGEQDESFRNLLQINLLRAESDVLRSGNPGEAVNAALRALELTEKRDDRIRLAELNLQLAKANIVWGRREDARAALERGIEAFRQVRNSTNDERRIAATDEAWQLFETAAELAILDGDLPRAFEMAEAARLRTVAEARRLPGSPSLSDVQRALGAGEAIVALNQFEDSLAVWAIRRNRVAVERRAISRREARRLVGRQRDEIRLAARRPDAGAELFAGIIRPVAENLRGATRLIVVPDAPYHEASFAAFWDPSSQRFLVEDVTLTLATSASSIVWGSRQPPRAAGLVDPLVLGSADAAAESGVRAVASVYRSASVLTGPAATPSRFFAEAPARSIVHVAAPVALNEDYPLLSRVLLADEGGRRYSGAVLGQDIAARPFAGTRLVVLGRPARIDSEGDADAAGVARAFLTAGVPAVVSLLPGTDERAAADVLLGFHRRLAEGMIPSQALTSYQRSALVSSGRRLGAWSALVMYGSDR